MMVGTVLADAASYAHQAQSSNHLAGSVSDQDGDPHSFNVHLAASDNMTVVAHLSETL